MGSGMQRFRTVVAEQDSGDRRYDTVLFDLYGTLVDIRTDENDPDAWEALRDFLDETGAHYDNADQLRDRFMGARALSSVVPAGRDPAFYEPDLLPTYRAMFSLRGMRVGERLSRKAAWVFRQASTRLIWLYPGALDMLKLLRSRGLRIILLSNAQSCYTRPELAMLGLADVFDDILISSEERVRKPGKEFFARALDRAGTTADRTVMVGNDEDNDILGARHAGIDGVYLRTGISPYSDPMESQAAVLSLKGADYEGLANFLLV